MDDQATDEFSQAVDGRVRQVRQKLATAFLCLCPYDNDRQRLQMFVVLAFSIAYCGHADFCRSWTAAQAMQHVDPRQLDLTLQGGYAKELVKEAIDIIRTDDGDKAEGLELLFKTVST